MIVSKRAHRILPSPTLALSAQAKKMKSEGLDVISFAAGEPDHDTPQSIKNAAVLAIENGQTRYTPARGTLALREIICKKFKRDNNLEYKPSQIVVSNGAKHSLSNLFLAILNDGDEVIIPAPYWVSYPQMVALAGGEPVFVTTEEANGFKLTPQALQKAITPKTKALLINSPNNPTGAVYSEEELRQLAQVAIDHELLLVSDEIYEPLVFSGPKHFSVAQVSEKVKERTVVINGVSKTYAMTGWRIGYLAASHEIAEAISNIQSQMTSNPCSISQAAALEAIGGLQDTVEQTVRVFDERRQYICKRLREMPQVELAEPQGAFYAFPSIKHYLGRYYRNEKIKNTLELSRLLLENALIAAVAGEAFGNDECLRFSYATSMDKIEEGMDRLAAFLSEVK